MEEAEMKKKVHVLENQTMYIFRCKQKLLVLEPCLKIHDLGDC